MNHPETKSHGTSPEVGNAPPDRGMPDGATFQLRIGDADTELTLPAVIDLLAAEPLRRTLCEALAAGRPILLDGGTVERASTPCLQVLLAASRSAQDSGIAFRLTRFSPALAEAFADLGLATEFAKLGAVI